MPRKANKSDLTKGRGIQDGEDTSPYSPSGSNSAHTPPQVEELPSKTALDSPT